MSFSNYLESALLGHTFSGVPYTAPTTLYVALFTTAPNTETAASGTEVSGGSYARVAVTANTTNFPAANPRVNGTTVTFTTPTANWGTVVAAGIYDASTGGNLLVSNNLTTSQTINTGNPVTFPAGSISLALD